jgi:hypothetical protein
VQSTTRPTKSLPGPATRLLSGEGAPFGIIDGVAVAMLILGVLLLAAPMVVSTVGVARQLPGADTSQRLLDLFAFAVIECFGVIVLFARGRLPGLSSAVLTSIINATVGSIPRVLLDVITAFRHRQDKIASSGKAN